MNQQQIKRQAMGMVNQLFDLAEVPVDTRQRINDRADEYLTAAIAALWPQWVHPSVKPEEYGYYLILVQHDEERFVQDAYFTHYPDEMHPAFGPSEHSNGSFYDNARILGWMKKECITNLPLPQPPAHAPAQPPPFWEGTGGTHYVPGKGEQHVDGVQPQE